MLSDTILSMDMELATLARKLETLMATSMDHILFMTSTEEQEESTMLLMVMDSEPL